MKRAVRRRMYAAAEAMMPGMPPQNLAVVAHAAADVAGAMVEGPTPRAMTSDQRAALAAVVEINAERFRIHLAKRSTAEAWESFDVPWDYKRTLNAVTSGRYAAALLDEAVWVSGTLAGMFAGAAPRTLRRARVAGSRELAARGGAGLLVL